MSYSQKYRVIVAHFDAAEQRRISRLLEGSKQFEVILTTNSGEACARRVASDAPDLVITETNLAGIDGLELIRRVKSRCAETKVLFLTCYDKLLRHPTTLANADYSILAPYTASLIAERALDLVRPQEPEFSSKQIMDQTIAALKLLNTPMHMAGYPSLCDGIMLSVQDPKVLSNHTGPDGLYAQLCQRYHMPYQVIEHRLRSIGDRILNSPRFYELLGEYLSPEVLERDHVPNLALIAALSAMVTDDLREELRQQKYEEG